jgi:hypothetical protein
MGYSVIVEVEGYEGDDGEIVVHNFRAERLGMGKPHIIYCIGEIDDHGLVRLGDWGYATEAEARQALGYRGKPNLYTPPKQ